MALAAVVTAQVGVGLWYIKQPFDTCNGARYQVSQCLSGYRRPFETLSYVLFSSGVIVSGIAVVLGILRAIAGGPLRLARTRTAALLLVACALVLLPAGGAEARGTTHTVSVRDNVFSPQTISIRRGDKIKWSNTGHRAHTTTSASQLWDNTMAPGETFTYRFTSPGTFRYRCTIPTHTGMTGTVTVT
jgi:plastocyanin